MTAMRMTSKQKQALDNVLSRPFQHKLKLAQNEMLPEVAQKYITSNLFSRKQKESIELSRKTDVKQLILVGGTRSGKTMACLQILVEQIKRVRKEADRLRGKTFIPKVIIAAYKRENIKNNITDPLENDFGIKIKPDADNNFMLFGVEVITTHTRDASGKSAIQGFEAWFAYVNEATLANRVVIEEIDNRLSGGEKPIMVMDTNPSYPHHWLKTDYVDRSYTLGEERDAKAEERGEKVEGWYTLHSTPEDNPFIPKSYIERIYAKAPGPGRDRSLGFWTTGEGAVYSHFDPKKLYITRDELPPKDQFIEYFAGVDWGWKDPTVFLLFGRANVWNEEEGKTEEITYLLKEVYKTQTHMEYWQELAKKWTNDYGRYLPFYSDSAEQDRIDKLLEVGANALNADKNIDLGIEAVTELIYNDALYIVEEEVDEFKKEIGSYEWNEKNGKPVDLNNHVMDALRYAIYTHKEAGQQGFGFY